MSNRSSALSLRSVAAVSLITLGLAGLWLFAAGSVLIRDVSGQVAAIELTNRREVARLIHLPGGIFLGVPTLEGAIRVRCRDGRSHEFGYVTRHIHISERADCR